ncbi:hypothetical protein [Luteimicrobium subarcticum]|uniref:UDP-N-acetylmuramyl pentapeptide phosphotransferase/UDP-N-acetylglucosamine-1-phosphate transferase n=1 Tax=Luteimicrobium subarcticum TaxID=620910 RepID=A0A2M8WWI7_9MICO|nr:hypothetical protein [Luteimicrobium subarcticum]PJI95288.1 hypothetical protein CLV34_0052 [Luteimicrobium subarcticum]
MSARRGLAGAGVAAVATWAARSLAARADVPGGARWSRTNHRGEPVSMLEGPAVTLGLAAGALVAAPGRAGAAVALATAGAGALGVVDDLAEDTTTRTKGLRGHLGALREGRLTTGGLKVLGIGASAFVAACVAPPRSRSAAGRAVDVVVDTALVAGTANLVNLLDLRPGRALKASVVLSALAGLGGALTPAAQGVTGAGALTGVAGGAAAAAAPADLGERDMLGDGGANALGALVGTQAALALPRPARLALLAGVVAATLASERVSFSAVIDRTPALRAVDRWGRRA